ncbi:MAG: glycoside hydrolase family 76 protein, partial [Deltaproteobacteria bacterium]
PHDSKVTASNAGPVIAGVRLWARTGQSSYLSFAKQVYDFWRAHFVDGQNQVADGIDRQTGQIHWWKFTYDEGLMVGAALELHEATGEARYLADARAFAAWIEANETEASSAGPVLFDGASCGPTCAQFKGIGYRYLDELARIDPSEASLPTLAASPSAIWSDARGPAGLFAVDWAGPPPTASDEVQLTAVTSALMALNLSAARGGQYPGRTFPANHLQAEEGRLAGLGLEASNAGFEGFGYVAGWGASGQSDGLSWTVPSAGSWRLTFRYAAGAGAATRALSVNGKLVDGSLAFPATAGWGNWSTVHDDLPLIQGRLSLRIDFASGDLNLDEVSLEPVPCASGSPPAAPSLSGPWNGAACCGIPPAPSWSAATGATGYDVVVDGAVACTTSATSCPLPSFAPGPHRWYVESTNGCGAAFSPERQLFISPVPAGVASPSPADGAAGAPAMLSWSASSPGSSFDVSLDGASVCVGLAGTSCTLTAPPASGCHRWQVTAVTGCGSLAGPVWSFEAP